jgi:hypothetical protein
MPAKSKGNTGRLRKATCPVCRVIVYMSRGAAIRHGMPSCACGLRLMFESLDDALEATPDHAHEHPDYADWTQREINRAVREAARVGAPQLRCGGCRAWIGRVNELHTCGFENDIRRGRNFGRWIEGASRAKADLPF